MLAEGFVASFLLLMMLLPHELHALSCVVCLPKVKGTPEAKQLAMLYRANVTRTFPEISEQGHGECSEYNSFDPIFHPSCPTDDDTTVCSWITNGDWTARTCAQTDERLAVGCLNMAGGLKYCKCKGDYCNYNSAISLSNSVLLTLLLAAVVAIVVV